MERPDYAQSGLDIQSAMLDHAKRYPDKSTRPPAILWGGREIRTVLRLRVPARGWFRLEFLSWSDEYEQGIDVKCRGGLLLADGSAVETLRTWRDPLYEDSLSYEYWAEDGEILVWNVYRWYWRDGTVTEEKWTGNAGLWFEQAGAYDYVLHCSPGPAIAPDFQAFVARISFEATQPSRSNNRTAHAEQA